MAKASTGYVGTATDETTSNINADSWTGTYLKTVRDGGSLHVEIYAVQAGNFLYKDANGLLSVAHFNANEEIADLPANASAHTYIFAMYLD